MRSRAGRRAVVIKSDAHSFGAGLDRSSHFHTGKRRDVEVDDRGLFDESFDEDVRHIIMAFALFYPNMDRPVVGGVLFHDELIVSAPDVGFKQPLIDHDTNRELNLFFGSPFEPFDHTSKHVSILLGE